MRTLVCTYALVAICFCFGNSTLSADTIYGSASSGTNGNALYSIDTSSGAANLLVSGLSVSPNSLATDSSRNRLYFGDGNGTTLWTYDLSAGGIATQVFDLNNSPLFDATSGLTGVSLSDGGAFHGGSYYAIIQRDLSGGGVGGGNSIYQFNFSSDGTTVTGINEMTIGTPGGASVGDLGDITISADGTVFGSSWDPSGGASQIGGYWSFDLTDPANTFNLIQDTTGLGNNAPTYQLATATDGTIYGTDFFTPLRLDVLDMNANITTGVSITGFNGSSFSDLSGSVVAVPEPSSALVASMFVLFAWSRKRRRV